MNFVCFAVRPMFSATDRLLLSRKAFISGVSIRHISRRNSPFRAISLYNVFSLKSGTFLDFYSVERFADTHNFFLIASLIEGYLLSVPVTKTVLLFSEIGFLPVLFRANTITLSFFLKTLLLLILNKKWLQ